MWLFVGTSARTTRIILLCVLSILSVGRSAAVMEEAVSSLAGGPSSMSISSSSSAGLQGPGYSSLVDPRDQLLGGKRAYTYRAEFKRLPLYQFGLGKRWTMGVDGKRTQPFSFGLGKRTRQYSFGLGKRDGYEDAGDASRYNVGYVPNQYGGYAPSDLLLNNYLQSKRTGGFNFGLGKRDLEMNGEEKLPAKSLRDKYLFGLGKRLLEEQRVREQKQEQQQDEEEEEEEEEGMSDTNEVEVA